MKTRLLTISFMLVLAVSAMASPARKGTFTYTQPDGTTFSVRLSGDEFCHFTTTLDGRPVVRRPDAVSYTHLTLPTSLRV